jgi:hypothetical protein
MANKPSFITDLITHAGQYGFQKSNRFIVFINGPGTEKRLNSGSPLNPINFVNIITLQRLALTCTGVNLPGRLISTEDVKYYNLGTKMPNFETYSQTLSLNFLCSTDMFERMYFKNWQDGVMNPRTHSPKLYDSYAKPFTITIMVLPDYVNSFTQLGNPLAVGYDSSSTSIDPKPFDDQTPDTSGIYFIKCLECYPTEITEIPLASNNSGILEMKVTMAFRKWVDPIEQFHTVKEQNDMSEMSRSILTQDPDSLLVDSFETPYADRGNVLNERKRDLTEDRVGPVEEVDSPWTKFRRVARDIIRYSNPKELKQLVVDKGVEILGSEFGIENVESAAQAGQIIDVFRRSPDYSYQNLRSRLLQPLSNIGNPETTINTRGFGFREGFGL